MKKEYDFSTAKKGKFYVPEEKIEYPIYLNKKVLKFFKTISEKKKTNLTQLVNKILEKEIDVQKEIQ